ncbi:MAG: septation protein A [Gammaproteobacteria bacterium]|nr:septation protein A [Gammaproteobacteria bacterium]NNF61929.1 septation protein A [Gammaproteobacteria bacterium]NNM19767.1 septation protein A [Gammaproteobacteria bacterium]
MQIFYDFFPVIAFFAAYKLYDIYVATGVIIVAVLLQVLIHWLRTRTISRMHSISAALVLVFGGITLALRNEIFIQWKPTVLNVLFGLVFLASQYIGEKPIIQRMLDASVDLEAKHWRTLNTMWALFFIFLGIVNVFVVYNFSEDAWVNFKLFGMLGLTVAFALLQGFWIARKMPPEELTDSSDNNSAE